MSAMFQRWCEELGILKCRIRLRLTCIPWSVTSKRIQWFVTKQWKRCSNGNRVEGCEDTLEGTDFLMETFTTFHKRKDI